MPSAGLRIAHRVLGPPMVGFLRAEVRDRERVPGHGGVLLAANHRSFLDHFILHAASPRPMHFLGKAALATGMTGRINVAMGMIPVERGRADLSALDAVVERLRAGEVVGVFPEGTRSPTGHLYRFRSGLGRIAADAQVPVVPVGLQGTAEAWPVGRRLPHRTPRGHLVIRFGFAVAPPSSDARARRSFTATVHDRIAELCGQPLADAFAPVSAPDG